MWEDFVNEDIVNEDNTSHYSILKQMRDESFNDAVASALMHECKHSAPGARLSARLRNTLERYPNILTKTVVPLHIGQSLLRILF